MSKHSAFERTDHRPWPLPEGPWVGRQSWRDLLFAHWPVPAAAVRPLVPAGLTVQEYDGVSWLGIVPFRMAGVTARLLPDLPGFSAFPELNVRVYVERDGQPGVWFLSLDATNPLAVVGAQLVFHLPYYWAHIDIAAEKEGVRYRCLRRGGAGGRWQVASQSPHPQMRTAMPPASTPSEPSASEDADSVRSRMETASSDADGKRSGRVGKDEDRAVFEARYGPTSGVYEAAPGTLEHWLAERYCLYAQGAGGALYRTEVHHWPWPLQRAEAEVGLNTISAAGGLPVSGPPAVLHFARRLDVVVWRPRRIED